MAGFIETTGKVIDLTLDSASTLLTFFKDVLEGTKDFGSWGSHNIEKLYLKVNNFIDESSRPNLPAPAPGLNVFRNENSNLVPWYFHRYNELYYLGRLTGENGLEEKYNKAEAVYRAVANKELSIRGVIAEKEKEKEIFKQDGDLSKAVRDFHSPLWGNTWHAFDGSDRVDDNGEVLFKADDSKLGGFTTVKAHREKISENEFELIDAESKLTTPLTQAEMKELGLSEYIDTPLSVMGCFDFMANKLDTIKGEYEECNENFESSRFYRELEEKKHSTIDIDARIDAIDMQIAAELTKDDDEQNKPLITLLKTNKEALLKRRDSADVFNELIKDGPSISILETYVKHALDGESAETSVNPATQTTETQEQVK